MSEEAILEELKKLREQVEKQSKKPDPVVVKAQGGNVGGVDLADLASGKVKVDMPEVEPCVMWDKSKTLEQLSAEGTTK